MQKIIVECDNGTIVVPGRPDGKPGRLGDVWAVPNVITAPEILAEMILARLDDPETGWQEQFPSRDELLTGYRVSAATLAEARRMLSARGLWPDEK